MNRHSDEESRAKRRADLFSLLVDAALASAPCPTNAELSAALDISWEMASKGIKALADRGLIIVESANPHRRIMIVHSGGWTGWTGRKAEVVMTGEPEASGDAALDPPRRPSSNCGWCGARIEGEDECRCGNIHRAAITILPRAMQAVASMGGL